MHEQEWRNRGVNFKDLIKDVVFLRSCERHGREELR
jgi:hypothetical protein